jgi:MFS family permease
MFLISLGVFAAASGLGALANDGSVLIATRFIKGMSAAFTAPAGLSIITTSFSEGPARNKALLVYTATAATGFSLGLVLSGILTEVGWRLTLFVPVPLSLLTLAAAIPLVPTSAPLARSFKGFDVAGALTLTAAMLLLVFTIVEAPNEGWVSARTLGSFAATAALLAAFVAIELRSASPLVRLGILRSGSLVRANLGAPCPWLVRGSAFSLLLCSTCSSCVAGRRSRPAWRSSPPGSSLRCYRRHSRPGWWAATASCR